MRAVSTASPVLKDDTSRNLMITLYLLITLTYLGVAKCALKRKLSIKSFITDHGRSPKIQKLCQKLLDELNPQVHCAFGNVLISMNPIQFKIIIINVLVVMEALQIQKITKISSASLSPSTTPLLKQPSSS